MPSTHSRSSRPRSALAVAAVAIALCAGTFGLEGVVSASASTQAVKAKCVSKKEFRAIDYGMRRSRVRKLIDHQRPLSYRHGTDRYRSCISKKHVVMIDYTNGEVERKKVKKQS